MPAARPEGGAWRFWAACLIWAAPLSTAAAGEDPQAAAGAAATAATHPHRPAGREPKEVPEFQDEWVLQDREPHVRHQAVLLDTGVWTDRLLVGAWYGLPLVHDGILPHINDAIVLKLGGDYTWLHDHGLSTHGLWLAVGPRWDLHLTRAWSLYTALRLGLFVTLATTPRDGPNLFQPGIGGGGMYRLTGPIRLVLDLSYPQGIRLGLNFDLEG